MSKKINRRGRPLSQIASARKAGLLSAQNASLLENFDSIIVNLGAGLPAAIVLGQPGAQGTSNRSAPFDHKHAVSHGDQDGGTLHAVATQYNEGFMSRTDKIRLDTLWANPPSSNSGSGLNPYVWHESPSGALDGSNTVFTLARSPVPSTSLALFRNGLLLRPGASADYTLTGKTVTFSSPSTPGVYDILRANYTIGLTLYIHVFNESPSGAMNGINATFAIAYSPQPTTSLQVFKNGMFQRPGATNDYTLSGKNILFTSPSIPSVLDVIRVFYTRGVNSF